jgi:hypothetical protein
MRQYLTLGLCLILSLGQVHTLAADTATCPHAEVVIQASRQDDVKIVCEAIQITLQLTKRYGLDFFPGLRIEVVDRFQAVQTTKRFGEFNSMAKKIAVLSSNAYTMAAAEWMPFGQQMTRALQRSLIVHELAHAVADWNFMIPEPGHLAHEYLAYVFQISSMPSDLRNTILQQIDVPGFQQASEINLLYYTLNPDCFGVKVYRHFLMAKDRTDLLQRLLVGELIPNSNSEDLWMDGME